MIYTTFSEYKCSSGVALEADGEGSVRRGATCGHEAPEHAEKHSGWLGPGGILAWGALG